MAANDDPFGLCKVPFTVVRHILIDLDDEDADGNAPNPGDNENENENVDEDLASQYESFGKLSSSTEAKANSTR